MNKDYSIKNPFEEHHQPVLAMLVRGKNQKQISINLDRPLETVRSQIKRMHQLAGAKTVELAYLAGKHRWI